MLVKEYYLLNQILIHILGKVLIEIVVKGQHLIHRIQLEYRILRTACLGEMLRQLSVCHHCSRIRQEHGHQVLFLTRLGKVRLQRFHRLCLGHLLIYRKTLYQRIYYQLKQVLIVRVGIVRGEIQLIVLQITQVYDTIDVLSPYHIVQTVEHLHNRIVSEMAVGIPTGQQILCMDVGGTQVVKKRIDRMLGIRCERKSKCQTYNNTQLFHIIVCFLVQHKGDRAQIQDHTTGTSCLDTKEHNRCSHSQRLKHCQLLCRIPQPKHGSQEAPCYPK